MSRHPDGGACRRMGEKFGNYEVLRKLATGGMAEVFLAKQTGLGGFERLVCIKRILAHLGEQDDFVKMFQDEARIAANLVHPNVAQIYDIGELDGSYYIAMEYVRGEDMRHVYNQEVARGRPMPPEAAAHIIMGAAAGLDYAHRQTTLDGRPLGIVHRDISPQNILITYDGHVKIVDFGVAKAAGKMAETRAGVLKGKYSYMSPEQASGDPVDSRTDIFAAGICLYEVTTGVRLFKRETELETLHAVIEAKVTPPAELVPGYDAHLQAIVLRALTRDADDRYQSAGEMVRDLERFLIGRGHAPSPASLASYMQELFAEKLADELLFGGPPWEESMTPSRPGKKAKPESSDWAATSAAEEARTGAATRAVPDRVKKKQSQGMEDTIIDESSAPPKGRAKKSSKSRHERKRRDDWGLDSGVSQTETHGIGIEAPLVARGPRKAPVVALRPETKATPKWFPLAAATALVLGLATSLVLVLSSDKIDASHLPRSGPLTVDSEPRGARIEWQGPGAEALNERYETYRTPVTITEGVPVDVPMRARFFKDGFDVAEVDLPQRVAGVQPEPLFVELRAGKALAQPATLVLLSTPPGAEVWVDGNRVPGTTPLNEVRVGGAQNHAIEFRLAGYELRTMSVYAEPGGRRFVDVTLPQLASAVAKPPPRADSAPAPDTTPDGKDRRPAGTEEARGFLTITSPVVLKVKVDGRPVGETPVRHLALDAGGHRIDLDSAQEGIDLQRRVRIRGGRTENLAIQLRKGNLAINAVPWARVSFGKVSTAETPLRVELYEG
ncbi:MAG: serine/threonine-protein kinase, partial [Myxococcota bacterium]